MDRARGSPRLDRTARLLGEEAMERLAAARVVVLGIGGVGTFAAEALVRAGVGHVTLVDGERVDETNANRQLHALVVDAMDTVVAKLHVIRRCLELGIPVVTSLGAARRLDPTAIRVTDRWETHTDQLAKDVRKYLRRRHGIAAAAAVAQRLTGIAPRFQRVLSEREQARRRKAPRQGAR